VGARASPIGRSHQEKVGARTSPIGRSHQEKVGARTSPIGRSHQEKVGARGPGFVVSDHPVCGAKVASPKFSLMPQPPLLMRRGLSRVHTLRFSPIPAATLLHT
jgi:hypothetical protein